MMRLGTIQDYENVFSYDFAKQVGRTVSGPLVSWRDRRVGVLPIVSSAVY